MPSCVRGRQGRCLSTAGMKLKETPELLGVGDGVDYVAEALLQWCPWPRFCCGGTWRISVVLAFVFSQVLDCGVYNLHGGFALKYLEFCHNFFGAERWKKWKKQVNMSKHAISLPSAWYQSYPAQGSSILAYSGEELAGAPRDSSESFWLVVVVIVMEFCLDKNALCDCLSQRCSSLSLNSKGDKMQGCRILFQSPSSAEMWGSSNSALWNGKLILCTNVLKRETDRGLKSMFNAKVA